jgi:hypothetical protein
MKENKEITITKIEKPKYFSSKDQFEDYQIRCDFEREEAKDYNRSGAGIK